jgi:hypothetical protein
MRGIKIGIGFGQWKYSLPAPELMCNYAEGAEAVRLDSIWLSNQIVSRNPTPDMTCIFAMTARCAVKAKAETVYTWNMRHLSIGEAIVPRLRMP